MPEILTKTEKIAILKERMENLKPELFEIKGWRKKLIEKYPAYDSMKWVGFITNMLALRTTDEDLLDRLEELVKKEHKKKISLAKSKK